MKGLNKALLALGSAATTGYDVYNKGRYYDLEKRKQDFAEGYADPRDSSKENMPVGGTVPNYETNVNEPVMNPALLATNNASQASTAQMPANFTPNPKKAEYTPSYEAGNRKRMLEEQTKSSFAGLSRQIDTYSGYQDKLGLLNKKHTEVVNQLETMQKSGTPRDDQAVVDALADQEEILNEANYVQDEMVKTKAAMMKIAEQYPGNVDDVKEYLNVITRPEMTPGERAIATLNIGTRRIPKTQGKTQSKSTQIPSPRQYMMNKSLQNQDTSKQQGASADYLSKRYNLGQ